VGGLKALHWKRKMSLYGGGDGDDDDDNNNDNNDNDNNVCR